jgi:hypothetical protein
MAGRSTRSIEASIAAISAGRVTTSVPRRAQLATGSCVAPMSTTDCIITPGRPLSR